MAYRVSETSVSLLPHDDVMREASQLRTQIRAAENELAVRTAWARAESRLRHSEFLKWRASAVAYLSRLTTRYAQIREREKYFNRENRRTERNDDD